MESANKGVTFVKIVCLPLLVIAIVIHNQTYIVECAFISSIQAQTYNTSDGRLCYKCSPGQHWVADCTRAGEVARCQPCANGSFQTVENVALTCQQCTKYCLQQHQDLITACNSTTDNICQCESGYYKSDIEGVCIKHRLCASGQFVKSPGNKDRDTICESCIAGHNFSSNESSTESCLPCTKCNVNGLVEITQCTITSDAKCGASGESHDIGAILGGTFGTLGIIIIIVIIVFCIKRHQPRVPNRDDRLPVV